MKPLFPIHHLLAKFAIIAATLALAGGCGRGADTITVYRIPKETEVDAIVPGANATDAGASIAVHWTAPSGWEEQPASGFRKGSFLARGADGKTADVSVISFPEAAGGLLANVNRWRDQLKLEPMTDVAQAGTSMRVAGREMFFVDLMSGQAIAADGSKSRILGGVFPLDGETWFFKMIGPDEVVTSQRDAFKAFLASVHPAEHSAEVATAPTGTPTSANSGGNTNAPTPPPIEPSQGAPLQYTLPPGWEEKPLSPMRLASFKATAPNGKEVDVSVVTLPGVAGGDLANVNRWRGQLNLAPIDENTLAKIAEHVQAKGHDYLVVDLASDAPVGEQKEKQRILAAIQNEDEHSWFIKMTGEEAAVASQKSAFTNFLQSLTLP